MREPAAGSLTLIAKSLSDLIWAAISSYVFTNKKVVKIINRWSSLDAAPSLGKTKVAAFAGAKPAKHKAEIFAPSSGSAAGVVWSFRKEMRKTRQAFSPAFLFR
jgi:hypothetical protein